jgi:hypothetical protein
MKTKIIILALTLGASTCLLTAQDVNPRPDGQRPPRQGGGPGGPGGPGRFHLLPPPVQEQLNLSSDQQKQVADLEAEMKAEMEKILTREQLQQLKQIGPPGRQGGPGGEGGPRPADGQLRPRREGDARGAGGFGGPGGGPGGPGGPGGMGGQRPMNPIVAALDLNKDGIIDAEEIAKASKSLKKLDKNGDRKLTSEEFRPQQPGGMGGPGGQGGPGMRGQRGPGMQGGGRGPGGQGGGGEDRPQRPDLEQ